MQENEEITALANYLSDVFVTRAGNAAMDILAATLAFSTIERRKGEIIE